MAPLAPFTAVATPLLPWPDCEPAGQFTVSLVPSFQVLGAAVFRNFVKFDVVPDASARCTIVMSVLGRVTPGLSAAIAGSFHFLTSPWKILAIVSGESCSLVTPLR